MPLDAASPPVRESYLHRLLRAAAPDYRPAAPEETRELHRRRDGVGYLMAPDQRRTPTGACFAPEGRIRSLPPAQAPSGRRIAGSR